MSEKDQNKYEKHVKEKLQYKTFFSLISHVLN